MQLRVVASLQVQRAQLAELDLILLTALHVVLVVLLEVDEHQGNVIAAVIVLAGLFHDLTRHLREALRCLTVQLLATHVSDHLG